MESLLIDVEAVIAVRTKRLQNKVADEAFGLEATEAKTKRGRRRAVFVLAEYDHLYFYNLYLTFEHSCYCC